MHVHLDMNEFRSRLDAGFGQIKQHSNETVGRFIELKKNETNLWTLEGRLDDLKRRGLVQKSEAKEIREEFVRAPRAFDESKYLKYVEPINKTKIYGKADNETFSENDKKRIVGTQYGVINAMTAVILLKNFRE